MLVEVDLGTVTLHVFLRVVQRLVDAAQELAARRFGQFRFVHELLRFAKRRQRTFRILLAQADGFGLALENFRVELAEDDLLSLVGRVDQRFALGRRRPVAAVATGPEFRRDGRSWRRQATGASCFGNSFASEMTAALPVDGQRQVIGRRRDDFGTNRSIARRLGRSLPPA